MAASLAFGVYFHFLVQNPDNVLAVTGSWHGPFFLTAVLVAVAGAAGVVAGMWNFEGIERRPRNVGDSVDREP